MSWLPVGDGVVDERGVLEFFEGVDPEDIQVRVVIPKGSKRPVSPVLASVQCISYSTSASSMVSTSRVRR